MLRWSIIFTRCILKKFQLLHLINLLFHFHLNSVARLLSITVTYLLYLYKFTYTNRAIGYKLFI